MVNGWEIARNSAAKIFLDEEVRSFNRPGAFISQETEMQAWQHSCGSFLLF